MRLLLQRDRAEPWQARPGNAWRDTESRVQAVCVQGVTFSGYDGVSVEEEAGSLIVSVWKDRDPGARIAQVWTFRPLAPDPRFGLAYNTRQSQVVYAEPRALAHWPGAVESTAFRPWSAWTPPPADRRRVMTPYEASWARARHEHGWREWTETVDAALLDAHGHVRDQRAVGRYDKPRGTKTYYQSNTAAATGLHAADFERSLVTTTATSATQQSNNFAGGASRLTHCFTTEADQPNSSAWPTGTYRCQLDCTAAGAGMSYGLRTAGSAVGHFARVASDLSSELETKAQTEALFTGTGLKLSTTGSVSWSAGSAGDRFEVLVAGTRAASTGNQTYTLRVLLADDFVDGPWTSGNAAVYLLRQMAEYAHA